MIERRDPHQSPGFDSNVERTAGIEAALHLERPASAGPASGADDVVDAEVVDDDRESK